MGVLSRVSEVLVMLKDHGPPFTVNSLSPKRSMTRDHPPPCFQRYELLGTVHLQALSEIYSFPARNITGTGLVRSRRVQLVSSAKDGWRLFSLDSDRLQHVHSTKHYWGATTFDLGRYLPVYSAKCCKGPYSFDFGRLQLVPSA